MNTDNTNISTKRKSTRDRIISAAIKLWAGAYNMQKVSLADIAREAGVSQAPIYYNFGTREGLVREVIRYIIREALDEQWAIIRSDLPIPQKLQGIIAVKVSAMQTLHNAALSKLTADTSGRTFLNKMYESEIKPANNALIEECKQQGYIHPDLPNEAIMIYVDMLGESLMGNTERVQLFTSDSPLLRALIHIIFYGLFQKESDSTDDFATGKEEE